MCSNALITIASLLSSIFLWRLAMDTYEAPIGAVMFGASVIMAAVSLFFLGTAVLVLIR